MNRNRILMNVRFVLTTFALFTFGACAAEENVPAPSPSSAAPAAPTIDLRTIGYSRGAENAPVSVLELADFGCPYCAMFAAESYPELHEEFVTTGKVRWTYVPIVTGKFPNGAESARAAECAGEQGKFWEMHELLYQNQEEWKASQTADQLYAAWAEQLGLDSGNFASCYREDRGAARTAMNNQTAAALNLRGTPTFLINGQLVEGAIPAEPFRQYLSSLLAAAP
jgi:protein-disulfide isomerase